MAVDVAGAVLSFLQGVVVGWGFLQLWMARRHDWTVLDGYGPGRFRRPSVHWRC